MPIKRFSDATSYEPPANITSPPESSGPQTIDRRSPETSDINHIQEDYDSAAFSEKADNGTRTVGRTYPDFFAETLHEPRVAAVVLLVLPITIFAFAQDLKSFRDLLIPTAVGVALNLVWFIVPQLTKQNKTVHSTRDSRSAPITRE